MFADAEQEALPFGLIGTFKSYTNDIQQTPFPNTMAKY